MKLNKIASDNMFVLYSSTITMMHTPINLNFLGLYLSGYVKWDVYIKHVFNIL